jgi:predicted ABC-type ATPase
MKTRRIRIFAGPNGSGKSTVFQTAVEYQKTHPRFSFGKFINADEIAEKIKRSNFQFSNFNLKTTIEEFCEISSKSGLLSGSFTFSLFKESFTLLNNVLFLINKNKKDQIAQIIAEFLRVKLLDRKSSFSFETVFSHPSKLEFIKLAKEKGYKIYLYFIATESSQINISRVNARSKDKGHDVPTDKIIKRYSNSLNLLFDACQLADNTYFFDNSEENPEYKSTLFASFKKVGGNKKWIVNEEEDIPYWFIKYYSDKVILNQY